MITTLILLGRFFEARARRQSGEAIRALLELGAKEARVLRDGVEVLVRGRGARRRRPLRRPAGREDRDGRRRRGGRVGGRPVDADGRVGSRRRRAGRGRRGGDDQHARPARRARDAGRRRDGARADREARRGGAGRQGADPAARRPRVGRLRPDRDRALARDARRLAAASTAVSRTPSRPPWRC